MRVYLRVADDRNARRRARVAADLAPNPRPLTDNQGEPLHTVCFALELEIPAAALDPRKWPAAAVKVDQDKVATVVVTIENHPHPEAA